MRTNYYPHIDGLRAVAVLAILLFHLDIQYFAGGYIGVDIFFVISGFLITSLLKRELDTNGTVNFKQFYIRRIKRIIPALLATLIFSFVFSALIFSPTYLQTIAGALWSALLSVSNVYFWLEADYFDTSAKLKPFLHTWSLGVEEQYYLLWPLFLFAIYRGRCKRFIMPFILAILIFSLYLNFKFLDGKIGFISEHFPKLAGLISNGKSTLFFLLPFRVYEFAIGAGLAWLYHKRIPIKFANDGLLILGIALILYSLFTFTEALAFPYWYALIPCSGAALAIYAGGNAQLTASILSNRLMVGIGIISYALYLVHWPLITFWHYLNNSANLTLTNRLSIGALTLILAYLLYELVERPCRNKDCFSRNIYLRSIFIASFATIFIISWHAYTYKGWEWRITHARVAVEYMENGEAFHKKYYGGSGYPYSGAVRTNRPPNLILMGDSHARHYADGLYKIIAEPHQYALYLAPGVSCLHLPNFTRIILGSDWDNDCPAALNQVLQYIKSSDNPSQILVLISHHWDSQIRTADILDAAGKRQGLRVSLEHVEQGILQLKRLIGEAQLVVIGHVPEPKVRLYDVFTRPHNLIYGDFNTERYLHTNRGLQTMLEDINARLNKFAQQTGSFIFIDPFDYLCDENKCRHIDAERHLMYSDNSHLSTYGSLFMMRALEPQLLSLLNR